MIDFSKYTIDKTATLNHALVQLNNLSSDILTLFVLDGKKLYGTLTDGDARRALISGVLLTDSLDKIVNKNYHAIHSNENPFLKLKDMGSVSLLPFVNSIGEIVKVYNLKQLNSILPIDAILMAGGKGERLRPLTDNTPKPLLKVGSKAIIDYNIDNLLQNGVESINVTVNYLAEQIEKHFEAPIDGIKVRCIKEPRFFGTMGSVKLVNDFKHDTVLVMNSDLFTNIDLADFYRHFLENGADMAVASIPYTVNIPFAIFDLEGRNIKSLKEKPTYNYYANSGIYLFKRKYIDMIPKDEKFNATDLVELLISEKKNVIRYPLLGYWVDIGRPEDYSKVQDFVKHIQ